MHGAGSREPRSALSRAASFPPPSFQAGILSNLGLLLPYARASLANRAHRPDPAPRIPAARQRRALGAAAQRRSWLSSAVV